MDIVPVILSGGVGSRLWPLSRKNHPKPFIKLPSQFDSQSLIQRTYSRALSISKVKEVVTVTNKDLYFYTKDEYEEVQVSGEAIFNSFLLEPCGRNSSAAIALASHYVRKKYGQEAIILVFPADHLIANMNAFIQAVSEAIDLASKGNLVTFGIRPTEPNTAYGYIQAEGSKVIRFVEKPDLETARTYMSSGDYLWNAGIFCMRVDQIQSEMALYCPSILSQTELAFNQALNFEGKNNFRKEIKAKDFEKIPDISIDYALFEKSKHIAVVPCDLGWSDIGSFTEFSNLFPVDQLNNHVLGDVVLEDSENCFIHSDKRLVAGLGLKNLMIVDTQDALLVADKNRAQDVRKLVKTLEARGDQRYELFETVHRPWGTYSVLQESAGYKLKKITVKPRASLSLQSHEHRSEHWVVVEGIAKVINGDQVLELKHNQSTYIPAGNKHRLENPGEKTLVLIEIQCGGYLGEDDIVRYDDVYGRK